MKPITEWNDHDFLRQAYANARDMADGIVPCGAVLAPASYPEHHLIYGANTLPRGIKKGPQRDDILLEAKCLPEITSATCSVIHLAAFRGVATQGATLYYTNRLDGPSALAIINSGITRVVGVSDEQLSSTLFLEIHELFRNVGVEYTFLYNSDIFPKEES